MTSNTTKPLASLIRNCAIRNLLGTLKMDIEQVVYDSRKVNPNSLFVAIPGFKQDGTRFIHEALKKGATAIVTQVPLDQISGLGISSKGTTFICVERAREALAHISKEFYNNPSRKLQVTGITGTNGKTTTTYILENIFRLHQTPTGVIGSINYHFGDKEIPSSMTTPEAPDIDCMLNEMHEQGIGHCFLEVSSHSLALQRVQGIEFAVGVFTNFSQDHLDFHDSLEHYKSTKLSFFSDHQIQKHVMNIDDPVGQIITHYNAKERLTVGIDQRADVMAENYQTLPQGVRFQLKTPMGSRDIVTSLLGIHNVYNLITSAAAALIQGIPLDTVAEGLETMKNVAGRFESINCGQNFHVLVDYAHTDDALKNALNAARSLNPRNLIVVFGCGGDRDKGKRKLMGATALELADYSIITSDNPRSEDPDQIIRDIWEGVPLTSQINKDYELVPDRQSAIEKAIKFAQAGDLVLIAGKGHENYQILKDQTIHFDDCEVARSALKMRLSRD